MPRQSTKKKLYRTFQKRYLNQKVLTSANIAYLEEYAKRPELDESDRKDLQDIAEVLHFNLKHNVDKQMMKYIKSKRYIVRGKHNAPKLVTKERRLEFLLNQIDDEGFVNELRMDRNSFNALYNLIKDHPLYQSNGTRPQTDVRMQMAIVLERLGSYGNGSSIAKLARRSGVGSKYSMTQ